MPIYILWSDSNQGSMQKYYISTPESYMLESDLIFGTQTISPFSGPGKCCELTYIGHSTISNKNSKMTDHYGFQKVNLLERPGAPVLNV